MISLFNCTTLLKESLYLGKQACRALFILTAPWKVRNFSRHISILPTSVRNNNIGVYYLISNKNSTHSCSTCGQIHVRQLHTSLVCFKKRKTKEEKKSKFEPVRFKPKAKIKSELVEIWANMTVEELAIALNKDIDHVFEVMFYIKNCDKYDHPRSIIGRLEVIQEIVKKSGKRCIFKPNPVEVLRGEDVEKDAIRRPLPDEACLVKRAPVITIMGHVDHGKTTLLDALRHTSVVDEEFGGITQHIGAFSVELPTGATVTFLDTPGHAAFSAMRARGAQVTDIIVLVVAADDGVMPQTKESIQHALSANVPIIVAINKIDKYNANVEKSKRDLLECGIVLEEFGGEVQSVPISALKGKNLDLLVEAIATQAEVMNLKADPAGFVEGYVIESRTDSAKGKLATVIVQRGTLKKGAVLVAGTAWAKVKSLYDHKNKVIEKAPPSTPVEVSGWKELPSAGDEMLEVESEGKAKSVLTYRESIDDLEKQRDDYDVIKHKRTEHDTEYKAALTQRRLEGWFRKRFSATRPKEVIESNRGPQLTMVLKGDVDGSVEALLNVLSTYHHNKLALDIMKFGVGAVTLTDVELAHTFEGVVYAFNVPTLAEASQYAKANNVPIRHFNIIYRLIEDLKVEISSRLPLVEEEVILGEANVMQEFLINEGKNKIPVAGCICTQGLLKKSEFFRLKRGNNIVHEGKIKSLRHLKTEVDSVLKNIECGLKFDDPNVKFELGDSIICLKKRMVNQITDWDPGF